MALYQGKASVEVPFEEDFLPIEHALGIENTTGWRAASKEHQLMRLRFDEPQTIRRIQLHFIERAAERVQEFSVYAGRGDDLREVLRQQWSCSPGAAAEELENYCVNLTDLRTLEFIDPDRSHDPGKKRDLRQPATNAAG